MRDPALKAETLIEVAGVRELGLTVVERFMSNYADGAVEPVMKLRCKRDVEAEWTFEFGLQRAAASRDTRTPQARPAHGRDSQARPPVPTARPADTAWLPQMLKGEPFPGIPMSLRFAYHGIGVQRPFGSQAVRPPPHSKREVT